MSYHYEHTCLKSKLLNLVGADEMNRTAILWTVSREYDDGRLEHCGYNVTVEVTKGSASESYEEYEYEGVTYDEALEIFNDLV